MGVKYRWNTKNEGSISIQKKLFLKWNTTFIFFISPEFYAHIFHTFLTFYANFLTQRLLHREFKTLILVARLKNSVEWTHQELLASRIVFNSPNISVERVFYENVETLDDHVTWISSPSSQTLG